MPKPNQLQYLRRSGVSVRSPRARRQSGMTLMEIMVVIFLVGLMFAIGMPSFNALTHAKLRKTSTRLAGTIRYLYNQAAMKGLCMRLKFDLKRNRYQVEVSTDGKCLIEDKRSNALQAKRKEEDKKKKDKKKKEAASEATTIGGWSGEKPISLEVKKATFQAFNSKLLKSRGLPSGIVYHSIFVSHQKEAYSKTEGPRFAYLHCFPLGHCERAMIYIKDPRGNIFSLEVKPLTGRVVVYSKKMPLTDRFTDQKKGDDDE